MTETSSELPNRPASASSSAPVLELVGITKRFGPKTALADVGLELAAGEVHALLGENGAGKTTLMNIATGILVPDAGRVAVGGSMARLRRPRDAFQCGIGMVHQHFRLVEQLTVGENLYLGSRDVPIFVTKSELEERAERVAERFGVSVNCEALVSSLSVGERQRVAILRALVRNPQILVLDEPTAVLTPQEAQDLFRTILTVVADGRTVVFISHKLNEVMSIADRITVLRHGRKVTTLRKTECDKALLARLMVGHELPSWEQRPQPRARKPILELRSVHATNDHGMPALRDVSLIVREGEIFGVAGVAGNGQSQLAEVITGLRQPTSGTIHLADRSMSGASVGDFIKEGVGHIPEDAGVGLALGESVVVNAPMKEITSPPLAVGPLVVWPQLRAFSKRLLSTAGVATVSPARPTGTLSGGQRQRLLVHRELRIGRRLIVAVHPSHGLDIAAAKQVHEALLRQREDGAGVIVISEDLDELLELSDRLGVMYEGHILAEFERGQFARSRIGLLMGGVIEASASPAR